MNCPVCNRTLKALAVSGLDSDADIEYRVDHGEGTRDCPLTDEQVALLLAQFNAEAEPEDYV